MRCVLYLMLIVVVFLALAEARKKRITRRTREGRVRGKITELSQVFYGIRYAAPAQRWTVPEDPVPYKGSYDASDAKPMCYQATKCSQEVPIDCIPQKSEDCLYLNIFAPLDTQKNSAKAVLFFLHGGSFGSGTGAGNVYNAEVLANKGDIIVVTINYRLGPFGFLVTGTSSDDVTGNYGLKDQRLALKWVKNNIRRFGGDKKKITIAGQSAGAYSVAIHLSSGNVDNLFARAILHSAPLTIPLKPVKLAIQQGFNIATQASCVINGAVNTSCLLSKSAAEIQYYGDTDDTIQNGNSLLRGGMVWLPHIDGEEVKTGLIAGFLNSSLPPKDIIIGTTADEGLPYLRELVSGPLSQLYGFIFVGLFAPNVPSNIWSYYPVENPGDVREEMAVMTTDYVFACPARLIATNLLNRMPVYMYAFEQPLFFPEAFPAYCIGRVCHGSDIPFVFQSARIEPFLFNAAEIAFSDKVVSYWASFVKYGDPNQDLASQVNGTAWKPYTLEGRGKTSTVVLSSEGAAISHVRRYKSRVCDVWDSTGYQ